MVNLAQKTPFARAINDFAEQKVLDGIAQLGKALPAKVTAVQGSIVTVSFDVQSVPGKAAITLPNVTCPIACSQWIRPPIQAGDQGVVIPSDVSIGGIDGIGTGTATLNLVGNLSAVQWLPTASKGWVMDDPNSALINGPNGVILRDQNKQCTFTLTPTGIVIAIGGTTIFEINASGVTMPNGAIVVTNGNVTAGSIDLQNHVHTLVQSGSDESGPPQG